MKSTLPYKIRGKRRRENGGTLLARFCFFLRGKGPQLFSRPTGKKKKPAFRKKGGKKKKKKWAFLGEHGSWDGENLSPFFFFLEGGIGPLGKFEWSFAKKKKKKAKLLATACGPAIFGGEGKGNKRLEGGRARKEKKKKRTKVPKSLFFVFDQKKKTIPARGGKENARIPVEGKKKKKRKKVGHYL